ncbi:MAG: hypothetical protein ACLVJ6_06995 [Merdibacter sp.]
MGGTPGSAALQTIFGVLQGIAGDIQSGLLTVVAPIAIAVCLYFLVRMLLASDAKDVATYRKRCHDRHHRCGRVSIPGLIRS